MADDEMFRWRDVSELDFLDVTKQALKMERRAYAECHKDRMWLRDRVVRVKRLLDRLDARTK